jgi:hypothetical protein
VLAYSPTYEYYNSVTLSRDEAKNEDVFAATVVTLRDRFSEWTFRVKKDLLVLGTDEMFDDVRGRHISTRITEPSLANHALYDGCRVVNTTITDGTHHFYVYYLQEQRGVPACMRR